MADFQMYLNACFFCNEAAVALHGSLKAEMHKVSLTLHLAQRSVSVEVPLEVGKSSKDISHNASLPNTRLPDVNPLSAAKKNDAWCRCKVMQVSPTYIISVNL